MEQVNQMKSLFNKLEETHVHYPLPSIMWTSTFLPVLNKEAQVPIPSTTVLNRQNIRKSTQSNICTVHMHLTLLKETIALNMSMFLARYSSFFMYRKIKKFTQEIMHFAFLQVK